MFNCRKIYGVLLTFMLMLTPVFPAIGDHTPQGYDPEAYCWTPEEILAKQQQTLKELAEDGGLVIEMTVLRYNKPEQMKKIVDALVSITNLEPSDKVRNELAAYDFYVAKNMPVVMGYAYNHDGCLMERFSVDPDFLMEVLAKAFPLEFES